MGVEHVYHIPRSIGNTTALWILKWMVKMERHIPWHTLLTQSHKTPTWADKMKEDSLSALIDDTLFKIDSAESTQKLYQT